MTVATAEALLKATIRRRLARTVLIKDSKAFDRLYRELQTALTRAWDDEMRKGIVAALDRLRDLGPGAFTARDGASIMRVLEERVGAEAMRAAMREPVVNLTDALFRTGAAEVGRATSVDIAFMRPDLDALDALKDNNLFWVGEHWDRHTKAKLDAVLTEYFTDGMTRVALAQRMADDFRSLTSRSHVYWQAVADHMATKGREIGRVTGYQRAGIQRVQIRAHLDERTTPVCRQLHGRVIEVDTLAEQRDAYFEASARGDKLAMADIWTMHGKGADLSNTRTRDLKGVGSPPYHYNCRTITVAYWGASDDMAELEQTITDRAEITVEQRDFIHRHVEMAGWMDKATERDHWKRHGFQIEDARTMTDYEASARRLIADPAAKMRVSTRVPLHLKDQAGAEPEPYAVFVKPADYTPKGGKRKPPQSGHVMAAVRLRDNRIVTYMWRDDDLTSRNDVVPGYDVAKSMWKRIVKWVFG